MRASVASGSAGVDQEDLAEIFVSVGRNDSISAPDLQAVLLERAGLDRAQTPRIRVRDKNSFVSVKREDLDRAVAALDGAVVGGKTIKAEPSRPRSSPTSSPNDA